MRERTTGAIALRPTGNWQGNFYYYNLNTNKVVSRMQAIKLPTPQDAVTRVHKISASEKHTHVGELEPDDADETLDDDEIREQVSDDDGIEDYRSDIDVADELDDVTQHDDNDLGDETLEQDLSLEGGDVDTINTGMGDDMLMEMDK